PCGAARLGTVALCPMPRAHPSSSWSTTRSTSRSWWPWASATTASTWGRGRTARAALPAIEDRRPDLVVLDVMLPDLDGFEVAKRLRQAEGAGTQVPVIFLTARDATADKVEGL